MERKVNQKTKAPQQDTEGRKWAGSPYWMRSEFQNYFEPFF